MKKTITVMAILFLLVAAYVYADPTGASSLNVGTTSTRSDFSGITPATTTASGGNLTALDIAGIRQTLNWQGFYGNITGEIVLDDANNNTFYNWSLTSASGEVYASRSASVTWGSIACASATNITSENTYLGVSATDGDSVTNTFDGSTGTITVGTTPLSNCPDTYTFVNDGPQSSSFQQILLSDSSAQVYATIVETATAGFDGGNYQFQLLVASDISEPYNFYVELA